MGSTSEQPVSILFVCLGNICRSPMAEAVFTNYITELVPRMKKPSNIEYGEIDSAGTGAYHVSSPPDPRTMTTLRHNGINDYTHSARKVCSEDFKKFDYILAMDYDNLELLLRKRANVASKLKKEQEVESGSVDGDKVKVADVRLFGDFGVDGSVHAEVGGGEEVPDPYYGGKEGFGNVYLQLKGFSEGFWKYLDKKHGGRA